MLIQEKFKAVGIVDKAIAENNALIRILALKDHDTQSQNLSLADIFPPNGCVFGPSFFLHNPKIKEGDLIELECQDNIKYTGRADHTKYIAAAGSINKKDYIKTYNLETLPIKDNYFNIKNISCELIDCNSYFCISDGQRVLGKLRALNNGIIEPVDRKRVHVWSRECCDTIDDGKVSYVKLPSGECSAYDCMDESKLFEWFRTKLRKMNPEYIKLLDEKTEWRQEFPVFFDDSDEESLKLERYRLTKVLDKLAGMELSIQDIKNLIGTSENFQKIFKESIEKHIESFKTEYEDELKKYSKKCDLQRSHLSDEIQKIEKKIVKETKRLKGLQQKINVSKAKNDNILKNKERILSDFSIIRDVLNPNFGVVGLANENIESPYVIEVVDEKETSCEIKEKKECLVRLEYFLERYKLNPKMASRLLNLILCYKGVFIKKIEYGVALAHALGNTKYVIQQVEPDWMHFKQFWENSLCELWQSSHENPDIIHLLLLEDINIASPECYARPLIDTLHGIRKKIPYAKNKMPNNLWILATKISSEDPPIGLPLYSNTFDGWGAIGFKGIFNPDENNSNSTELIDGYLTLKNLQNFLPEEFEKENINEDVKAEYKYLFNNE